MSNPQFPKTGDVVEAGVYACWNCPHDTADDEAIITLFKRGKLPECPVCKQKTHWSPQ